ncbi:hypothetical protein SBRCBS47491_000252 [Sporothrix bragantina]|uniref:2EXR domain-containing protein n=1 Tax=Sporothrix bragantina TaxID=671064 RepID=A0ABP0ANU5_9PEZI
MASSSTISYHRNHHNDIQDDSHHNHDDVPPTTIAVAPPEETAAALAFRRADGSRREFFFDDSIRSLPQPAASLFLLNRSPTATLPRNVLRPFRRDNDEPASRICFVRETRQAVCRDGQDRSRCSACKRKVTDTTDMTDTTTSETASRHYRWSMMSPQRVFRDLVMSDVAEPLRPALRDALLQAFNSTVEAPQAKQTTQTAQSRSTTPQSPTQRRLQQFTQLSLSRSPLPSPPPSPTTPRHAELDTHKDTLTDNKTPYPTEFRYFPLLPYEIRRMIWEQALPTRVLLRDDLGPSTYRGVRRVFRPASHTHSIDMLWRSDLFHVCTEARQVVQKYQDRTRKRGDDNESKPSDDQSTPLLRHATNNMRLKAGLDVLYYPWLGSESIHGHSGGGLWMSGRHYHGTQNGPHHNDEGAYPSHPSWISKMDASYTTTGRISSVTATLGAATISAVPYGHWASQLRMLRLPVTTVALDAAWIDRGHPDTIAWAAGVDLSEPDASGDGEDGQDTDASADEPMPPPTSLQVVVADIVVPVRIRLDHDTLTTEQRRLLRQHITPQSWADVRNYRREMEGPTEALLVPGSSSSSSSPTSSSSPSSDTPPSPPPTNLNGMDFTVLVGLYDDGRIEELLSLQAASDKTKQLSDAKPSTVLNKSALHRCIACTRRAWEAHNTKFWAAKFGPLLGAYLQKLCRPTIVFSVVLAFDGGEDEGRAV